MPTPPPHLAPPLLLLLCLGKCRRDPGGPPLPRPGAGDAAPARRREEGRKMSAGGGEGFASPGSPRGRPEPGAPCWGEGQGWGTRGAAWGAGAEPFSRLWWGKGETLGEGSPRGLKRGWAALCRLSKLLR